ncbi:MAG TPA: UbiA family prenyltransferase [Myxococcota bacterium]|nr:UbiA family prenyltransferase [Myxococcota bacterium]
MRVHHWWYFALLPMAAFPRLLRWPPELDSETAIRLPLAIGVALTALAHAYLVNAVSDRQMDRNPRKNALPPEGPLPVFVPWLAVILATSSVGMATMLGPLALSAALISIVAGTIYSLPPRLKSLPFLGLVGNALIFFPLLFLGFQHIEQITPEIQAMGVVFLTLLTQNQLVHELADREEDAARGDRTTGRTLGTWGTAGALVVLGGSGLVAVARVLPGQDRSWAAFCGLGCSTLLCCALLGHPSLARRLHRVLALVVGALLFAQASG